MAKAKAQLRFGRCSFAGGARKVKVGLKGAQPVVVLVQPVCQYGFWCVQAGVVLGNQLPLARQGRTSQQPLLARVV